MRGCVGMFWDGKWENADVDEQHDRKLRQRVGYARHFLSAAQKLLRAMKPRSGLEERRVLWEMYRLLWRADCIARALFARRI